jgi:RHH-type proline utilization regulon transcriptional repressor/proline dehydrogenase/delta 1-pyrroline-5-carboxylate dehydrogenase
MVRLVRAPLGPGRKLAQQLGLDYPVFTRKAATDASYLACAARLLQAGGSVFPQFATHNVRTVASILELAGDNRDFEFQKLHGMGDRLYQRIVGAGGRNLPCRVYAPVGSHRELLPYLVRRLLENGANSSFVHQIGDVPFERWSPTPQLRQSRAASHGNPRPRVLFEIGRPIGIDVSTSRPRAMAQTVFIALYGGSRATPPSSERTPLSPSPRTPACCRTVEEMDQRRPCDQVCERRPGKAAPSPDGALRLERGRSAGSEPG